MLETAHPSELERRQVPPLGQLARKIKLELKAFNEDNEGMNTVEAIILLFVAAIILLVFFTVIWPMIREPVKAKLGELFGQTG
jgi:hypothetical protein